MTKTIVTGGARSGKSDFALELASSIKGEKIFLATAQAFDDEMKERIAKHKENRPHYWTTVEEPLRIVGRIKELDRKDVVVLVDCLGLWVSNILLSDEHKVNVGKLMAGLVNVAKAFKGSIVFVTNEVGSGIVPGDPLSREFRDVLGKLNQELMKICDSGVLLVSGAPLYLKGKRG